MTSKDIEKIRRWFETYTSEFLLADSADDRSHIELKRKHTYFVADNSLSIAKGEGMTENESLLAHAGGLLHDVGRFPQYKRYQTFRDSKSVNHGELGAKTIRELETLSGLDSKEQEDIEFAVGFHNAFSVPETKSPEALRLIRLLRDADKLDIWRIMAEYFEAAPEERSPVVAHDLKDTPGFNPSVLDDILHGRMVKLGKTRVLNDFRLLIISWVYDLNFPTSYRLLLERGLIERIFQTLPSEPRIKEAVEIALKHVRKNASLSTN